MNRWWPLGILWVMTLGWRLPLWCLVIELVTAGLLLGLLGGWLL